MLAARNGNPDAVKVSIEGGRKATAKERARHDGVDVAWNRASGRREGVARRRRDFRGESAAQACLATTSRTVKHRRRQASALCQGRPCRPHLREQLNREK